MIGGERALIQTPRKRQMIKTKEPIETQRKWNGHVLLFVQVFYCISLYALFSSFCLIFYWFNANKPRSWSQGQPTAERNRQRKLSRHRLLFLQYYFSLFHFTH